MNILENAFCLHAKVCTLSWEIGVENYASISNRADQKRGRKLA